MKNVDNEGRTDCHKARYQDRDKTYALQNDEKVTIVQLRDRSLSQSLIGNTAGAIASGMTFQISDTCAAAE